MQKIGPNGDGKSAVATFDGRSRKRKKNSFHTTVSVDNRISQRMQMGVQIV